MSLERLATSNAIVRTSEVRGATVNACAEKTTIAEGTGGRYFRARDTEAFQQIYSILDELEPAAAEESGFRPIVERYHWPLGVALLLGVLWALAGFRGTLKGSVFAAADHG